MKNNFVDKEYPTRGIDGKLTGERTVIRYASDGKEAARFGYDASGQETFRQSVTCSENDKGLEKTVSTFRPDGSLLQKSITYFNKEGEISEILTVDAGGKVLDRQVYTYSHNMVAYSHFDETERLIEVWSRCIKS